MLPINLIGQMNPWPMNFIFNLITKTRTCYIIMLETSILNRNQTNLSQITYKIL
ncbi:hypothetical protein HanIR_Chr04g0181831 [Helianthus annuus]|nr:hypothetical protein HanIR_Chr04g0181831 [Helianthus annuus]